MATPTQRSQLLAVACPHCRAAAGEVCTVAGRHRKIDSEGGQRRAVRITISTLDGGCHDARWQAAGLGAAPVLPEAVADLHGGPVTEGRELVVATAAGERPW